MMFDFWELEIKHCVVHEDNCLTGKMKTIVRFLPSLAELERCFRDDKPFRLSLFLFHFAHLLNLAPFSNQFSIIMAIISQ